MKTTILTLGLVLLSLSIVEHRLSNKIDENAVTRSQYNEMKKRLVISEALVKKCAENDTIDIMQYVRDVKREIEISLTLDNKEK